MWHQITSLRLGTIKQLKTRNLIPNETVIELTFFTRKIGQHTETVNLGGLNV